MGVVEALEGACSPLEVCEVLESLDAEEALVEDIVPPCTSRLLSVVVLLICDGPR
jgi:hypothetical protein